MLGNYDPALLTPKQRRFALIVFFVAGFLTGVLWPMMWKAHAAEMILPGGGGIYSLPTKTLLDSRFKTVIRQEKDFSCGSAALATILTFHYQHPVAEHTVLDAMFEKGDKNKIRKDGFSLLDMKGYLNSMGYQADGYRDSLDKLINVGIPAIALINIKGYLHFVVVKGVTPTKVLVGDPARGTHIIPRKDFEEQWNGILFVITNKMDAGKVNFNTMAEWQSFPSGRFNNGTALADVAGYTLNIIHSPNYY